MSTSSSQPFYAIQMIFLCLCVAQSAPIFAQQACPKAHRSQDPKTLLKPPLEETVLDKILEASRAKGLNSENIEKYAPVLEKLSKELILSNLETIFHPALQASVPSFYGKKGILPDVQLSEVKDEIMSGKIQLEMSSMRFHRSSQFHTFETDVLRKGKTLFKVGMRTNGRVSFLDRSYRYRIQQLQSYSAVALLDGNAFVFDMGQLFLRALPEMVPLSRSMSLEERNLWISKNSEKLGSSHNLFSGKIHFGLGYYYFTNAPYLFEVPKSVLTKLYEKNLLEFNTYESLQYSQIGMSSLAQNGLGIETEFVILKENVSELFPFAIPSLQQQVLDFGS